MSGFLRPSHGRKEEAGPPSLSQLSRICHGKPLADTIGRSTSIILIEAVTKLGSETTANKADWREHLTVAPDVSDPSSGPLYRNLLGPSQWPDPAVLPKFRPAIQGLMDRSTKLTKDMRQLIAEAIGVDINMFESLFKENQQDKLRLIRYPEPPAVADNSEIQSLGAHQDTSFSTLIYQLSEHRCLQALDPRGEWINCPPIPGSIIYVLGQGFNAYTWGFCKACWHRVIPPPPGSGDRHSMAMPSYIGQDVSLKDPKTQEALEYTKEEISKRHPNHKAIVPQYMLEESKYDSAGQRVFSSYVKSFPEVTRRWVRSLLSVVRKAPFDVLLTMTLM